MVYRAYVEKKAGLDNEAQSLKNELISLLGIDSLIFIYPLIVTSFICSIHS